MTRDPEFDQRIKEIRRQMEENAPPLLPDPATLHRIMAGIPVRRSAVINLTKLNGTPFLLNPELIETIESTPDTIISLVTGRKVLVREPVDEVQKKWLNYKKEIGHNAPLT